MRRFRFGYQAGGTDPIKLIESAQAAEEAGFDVFHTSDHMGDHLSALAPLAAVAAATATIRVCPLVLNNDFHHPVTLAQELATLDRLSGGRLEVGIGAGHSFTEYSAMGVAFDPPAVRKDRLAESVELLRRLLDGDTVTHDGRHYHLDHARTLRPQQVHLPIAVGVNGKKSLAHAAHHADAIALTMLGRTLQDGQNHEVRWQADRLDATIAWVKSHTPHQRSSPELNALVQAVVVTEDRAAAAEDLAGRIPGLGLEDALTTPFLALGTHDEIARHLVACRQRWGISYYSVRDMDTFSPVIQRIRSWESAS